MSDFNRTDKTVNIAIAINTQYMRYAYVLLTSLLKTNSRPLAIYVFYHDLDISGQNALRSLSEKGDISFAFIYVPDSLLPSAEVLQTSSWGSEAYFRLAVTDLTPAGISRILYLDSDIIVNGDICPLYDMALDSNVIAACREFQDKPPYGNYRDELFKDLFSDGFSYFNSGMILYDMNAMRQKGYTFSYYMDAAQHLDYQIQYPDQDLVNYCHHGETAYADTFLYNLNARYAYNDHGFDYERAKRDAVILHYERCSGGCSNNRLH